MRHSFLTPTIAALIACSSPMLLAQELSVTAAVDAAPAPTIAYQGRLLEGTTPANGARQFVFSILDSSGVEQWSSGPLSVTVTEGLYSVVLGGPGMPGLPVALLGKAGLKLHVVLAGQALSPDATIVPAFQARSAWEVTGAFSGDLAGTQNQILIMKLQGTPLDLTTSAPTSGQALVFNGTKWVPSTVVGTPGPAGASGLQGATGATGAQGPIGLTGATGATGSAGTNGLDGKTVLSGNANPAVGVGANGDFYLNTTTNALWGPKAAGVWPAASVSLVGPAGAAGAVGAKGDTGLTGATGAKGDTGSAGATGASPFTLNGSNAVYTAGSVGIGSALAGSPAAPHASAALDVASTTKGFLPPRMTAADRAAIATPAAGLLVYQSDGTAGLYQFDGAAWAQVGGGSGGGSGTVTSVTKTAGSAITIGGTAAAPTVGLDPTALTLTQSQVTNLSTDLAAKVPTSTTVNGHALSANVTVSASDLTTGTLPHTQLPTLAKADVGLGNVDNTADANKPVSSATVTALGLKASLNSAPTFTGNVTAPTFVGALSGNATSATSATTAGSATTAAGLSATLAVGSGGTGTSNGSINGPGALTFTAGGSNQNVTLTPSGTGYTLLNGNVGVGTTAPGNLLSITAGNGTGLIWGGTSTVDGVEVGGAGTDRWLAAQRNAGSPLNLSKPTGASDNTFISFYVGGTQIGQVSATGGLLTFPGNITGNAATATSASSVTNGVVTTGSYADPGWVTSLAGSKISGDIPGNAATATSATTAGSATTAAGLSATLAVISGGTGLSGYTAGDLLYASGASTLAKLGKGSDGQVLTLASGLPTWATSASGALISDANANTKGGTAAFAVGGGSFNTAFGSSVLNVSTGSSNSAFGRQALAKNTSGFVNSAFGDQSLYEFLTGGYNAAFGANSLLALSSGSRNVAIGQGAFWQLGSGSSNIALGDTAGGNLFSGSSNIYIGHIGPSSPYSENSTIRIGSGQTTTFLAGVRGATLGGASPQTVVIDENGQLSSVSSGAGTVTSVAAGSGLTGGPISTTGTLSIATGGVTNGMLAGSIDLATKVTGSLPVANVSGLATVATTGAKADVGLGNVDNTSDASKPVSTATSTALGLKASLDSAPTFTGNVTAPTFVGALSGNATTATSASTIGSDGSRNTKAGGSAMVGPITGSDNVAVGFQAASLLQGGSNNAFLGSNAGKGFNSGTPPDAWRQSSNVGVGAYSLWMLNNGSGNVAVGRDALIYTKNAGANIGVGTGALRALTGPITAYFDTQNVAVGHYALQLLNPTSATVGGTADDGWSNVGIGAYALPDSTTGKMNVAIGTRSGTNNQSGNYNIYLGDSTNASGSIASNEIVIGYGATGLGSGTTLIGNASTTATTIKGIRGVTPTAGASAHQMVIVKDDGQLGSQAIPAGGSGGVTSVATGTGLTGGPVTTTGTIALADTAVTAGSYTRANVTVDAQGRLTAASSSGAMNLASEVTGVLPMANGGTGLGSGGTNGQVLTMVSGAPAWASGVAVVSSDGGYNTKSGSLALPNANVANGGSFNSAFGYGALVTLTNQQSNTAVGWMAGAYVRGQLNTAVGAGALQSDATTSPGLRNVAVGNLALNANSGGGNNVSVGNQALQKNTSSSENIAIGSYALQNQNFNVLYGNAYLGRNIAIGSYALQNTNSTASNTNAVATNGASNVGLGHYALSANTTGKGNIAVGNNGGLVLSTGNNNIYIGDSTNASDADASNEIIIGQGLTGLGSGTTLIGNASTTATIIAGIRGVSDLAGIETVVIDGNGQLGSVALPGVLTALAAPSDLTASAAADGNVLTWSNDSAAWISAPPTPPPPPTYDDKYNTFVGRNAMSKKGVISPNIAMDNVAVGLSALLNVTGNRNVGVGDQTLFGDGFTGSDNIALGNSAGSALTTGSYNIDIGNVGVALEANTIRIGTTAAGTGATMTGQAKTFIAGITGVTSTGGAAVYINADGQLGTVTSSRRFKENIQPMGDLSSRIFNLRPVTFNYKAEYGGGGTQFGLIAEEVDQVLPEMTVRDKDGQIETVAYQLLPPMLLNEAQKQHQAIEALQAENQTLKAENQATKAELATLKAQVAAILARLPQ